MSQIDISTEYQKKQDTYDYIRLELFKRKMTIRELSRLIGESHASVLGALKMEFNGKVSRRIRKKVCEYLELSCEDLFGENGGGGE
jgi:hypothetical protein